MMSSGTGVPRLGPDDKSQLGDCDSATFVILSNKNVPKRRRMLPGGAYTSSIGARGV